MHGSGYAEDRALWRRHYFGGEGLNSYNALKYSLCALHMVSTTVDRIVQNSSDNLYIAPQPVYAGWRSAQAVSEAASEPFVSARDSCFEHCC